MKLTLTLCIVFQDGKVLLGMKKRGFGEGLWNGFGGKVEKGETIEDSVRREFQEESGLEVVKMNKVGFLEFSFEHDEPNLLEVHVFKVTEFIGELVETDEMKPQWFSLAEIPFSKMWIDDKEWLPYLLKDKLFVGKFHFDKPTDKKYSSKILSQELFTVDSL